MRSAGKASDVVRRATILVLVVVGLTMVCTQLAWVVRAGVVTSPPAGISGEECLGGRGVSAQVNDTHPVSNMVVSVVGSRGRAEAIADCLRHQSYKPVTVRRGLR